MPGEIYELMDDLQRRFVVAKKTDGPKYAFGGCNIRLLDDRSIRMSMETYRKRGKKIIMSRSRKKIVTSRVSANKTFQYPILAEKLLSLGNGALPQASMAVSLLQQILARLTVKHLIEANQMVNELHRCDPLLKFPPAKSPDSVSLCTFSDAAHPSDRDYGQHGLLVGLLSRFAGKDENICHILDWSS
ncbi:hypothetical protein BWQ96_09958 [Gracilariopsis chorda]|uniref:Uncharacterized protein n=1 Tax=Gracilariopsis chorda TaxID=448386 RepID=A0A2V3IE48_9FLOR|nr:hypothetical protein BWQ96_09958 [Gracilariopsis chorda]|eukprot:PXF40337.1 hypothetical protein BWQ96_09958 [Gracilariopsis chorda]